jgi:hypothetical protein
VELTPTVFTKERITKMKCECLFCDNGATTRLTVPSLKPRFLVCDEHLTETLDWAVHRNAMRRPGAVVVEPLQR